MVVILTSSEEGSFTSVLELCGSDSLWECVCLQRGCYKTEQCGASVVMHDRHWMGSALPEAPGTAESGSLPV